MSEPRFGGKVAIVTGGASGLGAAIAAGSRREGARVVVADIDAAGAERVVAADRRPRRRRRAPSPCDVTRAGEVEAMVDASRRQRGGSTCSCCSAAVETRSDPVVDVGDDDWQHVLDVNLKGPFLCMKHAIPVMVAAAAGRSSRSARRSARSVDPATRRTARRRARW